MIVLFLAFSIPPDWVYLNAKTVQDRHTQRGIEMDRIDEAVEVSNRVLCGYYDANTDDTKASPNDAMRAALLAGVKVLLGEPVAWQRRIRASESHWSDWEEWIDMYGYGMQPKIGRWDAEYRPVYAPSLGEGE